MKEIKLDDFYELVLSSLNLNAIEFQNVKYLYVNNDKKQMYSGDIGPSYLTENELQNAMDEIYHEEIEESHEKYLFPKSKLVRWFRLMKIKRRIVNSQMKIRGYNKYSFLGSLNKRLELYFHSSAFLHGLELCRNNAFISQVEENSNRM